MRYHHEIRVHGALRQGLERAALGFFNFAWRAIGLSIVALMMLLEPVLRLTLVPLAFLIFFASLMFGFLMGAPDFPKWGMIGLAVGLVLLYWAYLWLLSLFTRLPHEID